MKNGRFRFSSIVGGPRRGLAVVVTGLVALSAQGAASGSPLADEHRRLVELIQGDTVMVAASPALCAAVGQPLLDPPTDVRDRYFRTGACMLPFATDMSGVVTRATQGLDRDLFDGSRVEALRAAVAAIRASLAEASEQERLMFHSTTWELLHALDAPAAAAVVGGALDALRCESMALLRESSYTSEEAAALPSTLGRLPELSGEESIAELARRIMARDPDVVELLPPPEAHARLLHGRFTLRVFFTGKTAEASRRVREYLLSTPYEAAGRLPLEVPDVVSVLILYFNVLDHELSILPTEEVAFWQQYSFDGQLNLEREEMEQAEDTVRFVSVRYQRNYESDQPRYAALAETAMSRTGFVDGMPSQMSAPVTTLRGACIRCHRRVISSFHPEEKREVRFTRPLEVSGRGLLTPEYTGGAEARLRQWSASCQR